MQWLSLCLLCLGVGLVQTSSVSNSAAAASSPADAEESVVAGWGNQALGLMAVVAACCSSGLAGVYF